MDEKTKVRIQQLEKQIEFEKAEEERHADMYRPLIKEVDQLTKSIFSSLINRSRVRELNKRMQHYADIANKHQDKAAELRRELYNLEYDNR